MGKVSTFSPVLKSCDVGICLPDLVTTSASLSSVSSSVCLLACTEARARRAKSTIEKKTAFIVGDDQ